MTLISQKLVSALEDYLRGELRQTGPIILHEPYFGGRERDYVNDCIDSGWVSSVGAYVTQFEQMLCDYTGVKHAIATVNGTAALHTSLHLLGIGPGDEVLCPALSFIATANAIAYCGAAPHFVDIEDRTLGIDPVRLEVYLDQIALQSAIGLCNRLTGRPIKALVVMHTFGHPADLDGLTKVCSKFGIPLVEDAAESLGSLYKGRHTGNDGFISAVSFNGNKIVTTGGGGAVLTNDPELARRARHLTTTAKSPHRWEFRHDEVGFNYRLPNINAALGCAQLEQLAGFVEIKRQLTQGYSAALNNVSGISLFIEPEFARSNYWLQAIILDQEFSHQRDEILALTNDAGIMTRPVWVPLNQLPMFSKAPCDGDLPVTRSIAARLINVPSGPVLISGVA